MVKKESYILVGLTAYRNIHYCKYKQYLHEEFLRWLNLLAFVCVRSLLPTELAKGHHYWHARRQGFLTRSMNIIYAKIVKLTYLRRLSSVSLIVQNLIAKGISVLPTFRSTSQSDSANGGILVTNQISLAS